MNPVLQRGYVHMLPVRAPTHTRNRIPDLPNRSALLASLALYTPVRRPVEGVNDPAVGANLLHALLVVTSVKLRNWSAETV